MVNGCYGGGQCNGGRIVIFRRWSVKCGDNDVTEKVILIGGEWSCYRSGHFNGERMVITEVASLKKGEWLI